VNAAKATVTTPALMSALLLFRMIDERRRSDAVPKGRRSIRPHRGLDDEADKIDAEYEQRPDGSRQG
jgi:hypothetical protein